MNSIQLSNIPFAATIQKKFDNLSARDQKIAKAALGVLAFAASAYVFSVAKVAAVVVGALAGYSAAAGTACIAKRFFQKAQTEVVPPLVAEDPLKGLELVESTERFDLETVRTSEEVSAFVEKPLEEQETLELSVFDKLSKWIKKKDHVSTPEEDSEMMRIFERNI